MAWVRRIEWSAARNGEYDLMAKSTSFSLALEAFAKKAGDNADLVVRKVVLDLGTRIVERSPVGNRELWADNKVRMEKGLPLQPKGYIGGRFRANWQYGNMSGVGIPMSDLPDIDASGAASINRIAAGVPTKGAAGMVHFLKNNLPYAKRLEEGWSTQAPGGMVGITVREFQSIVDDAVGTLPDVFRSGRSK